MPWASAVDHIKMIKRQMRGRAGFGLLRDLRRPAGHC
jgi:transposase